MSEHSPKETYVNQIEIVYCTKCKKLLKWSPFVVCVPEIPNYITTNTVNNSNDKDPCLGCC